MKLTIVFGIVNLQSGKTHTPYAPHFTTPNKILLRINSMELCLNAVLFISNYFIKSKLSQYNYPALNRNPRPQWRKCFYWFLIDMSHLFESIRCNESENKSTRYTESRDELYQWEISKYIFATGGAELSWGQDNCIGIVYFKKYFILWKGWPRE